MSGSDFPVIVRAKSWQRWAYGLFVGLMLLCCLSFFLLPNADAGVRIVLGIAFEAFFGAMGWNVLASRTTLWPDRIETWNGFWHRTVLRAAIKGYRQQDNGEIQLEAGSGWTDGLTLPWYAKKSPDVWRWLGPIPNLTAADRQAEEAALEADPALGANVEDRRALLRRLRRFELPVSLFGAGVIFWAMLDPRPYVWVMIALALLPGLGFALQFAMRFQYDSARAATDPRPAFVPLYFAPATVTFRALLDIDTPDARSAILYAVIGGGAASALLWPTVAQWRKPPWVGAIFSLGMIFVAYGAVLQVDTLLDRSAPQSYPVAIRDMHMSTGRYTSYAIDVTPWGPDATSGEVDVNRGFYESVHKGQRICMYLQKGYLGIRWYYAGFC